MTNSSSSGSVVVPSRFLADESGTYDLASVSAVITNSQKVATLVLDGSIDVKTQTPYPEAVAAWQAYLGTETEEAAPAAPKE